MKSWIISTCLLLLFTSTAQAQDGESSRNDSLMQKSQDTVLLKTYADRYNPNKAILYAAIFPGAGQIYTKKYWKLPLVYGGFVGIGYGIKFYNDLYKEYKSELYYNLENGYTDNGDIRPGDVYTTQSYRTAVDRARRERDFMVICMFGMYLLQMIDAHVDAHLKEFDVNPNLQVKLQPLVEQDQLLGRQTGVSLIFKF